MRIAILMGLVFIGDNIGRGLGAELKSDPTLLFAVLGGLCLSMDIAELFINPRK